MSRGVAHVVTADLVWRRGAFEDGTAIAVGDDGRIAAVGPAAALAAGDVPVRRLGRRALLPGFVDAHSHAFQRGLRGHGERFPPDGASPDSFWGWREAMYGLVEDLDRERFRALCVQAFGEMLDAGVTTVGELHYLHHDRPGDGNGDGGGGDFAFDEVVLEAARETGIRLVLLQACYQTGGFGRGLAGGQRRFATPRLDDYWRQMDRLAARLDPATQSLGVAAHSLRAVPVAELARLHAEARRRGLVFHLHLEEQRREIEDCKEAEGRTPMRLLLDAVDVGPELTAVHCTHTLRREMALFQPTGATVCVCPTTEANLGDGIADVTSMLEFGGQLALGTDSNARISMTEEMRWLEYVQRLAGERRGVVRGADGDVAARLVVIATAGGARSLGVDAGEIAPGRHADLVAVDLDHPSLAGWTPGTLLAAFVLGAGDAPVREVAVGGRWVR